MNRNDNISDEINISATSIDEVKASATTMRLKQVN